MSFTENELMARRDYRERVKIEKELDKLAYDADIAAYADDRELLADITKSIAAKKRRLGELSKENLVKRHGISWETIKKIGTYHVFVDGEL